MLPVGGLVASQHPLALDPRTDRLLVCKTLPQAVSVLSGLSMVESIDRLRTRGSLANLHITGLLHAVFTESDFHTDPVIELRLVTKTAPADSFCITAQRQGMLAASLDRRPLGAAQKSSIVRGTGRWTRSKTLVGVLADAALMQPVNVFDEREFQGARRKIPQRIKMHIDGRAALLEWVRLEDSPTRRGSPLFARVPPLRDVGFRRISDAAEARAPQAFRGWTIETDTARQVCFRIPENFDRWIPRSTCFAPQL